MLRGRLPQLREDANGPVRVVRQYTRRFHGLTTCAWAVEPAISEEQPLVGLWPFPAAADGDDVDSVLGDDVDVDALGVEACFAEPLSHDQSVSESTELGNATCVLCDGRGMKRTILAVPFAALLLTACSGSADEAAPAATSSTTTATATDAAWTEAECEEATMADWTAHCTQFTEEDPEATESETSAVATETPLGGTYQGERSTITVAADPNYEFSKETFGAENAVRAVLLTFTVENQGTEVMEAYNFLQSATFAGAAAEMIADMDTSTTPAGDILPGRTATWTTAYAIPTADAGELIVSVGFGMSGNIYFTGTV